jgi:hypothetical protein
MALPWASSGLKEVPLMLGQPPSVGAGEVAPAGIGVVLVGDSVWVVDDGDPVDDDSVDNADVPIEPGSLSPCGDVDEESPRWSDAAELCKHRQPCHCDWYKHSASPGRARLAARGQTTAYAAADGSGKNHDQDDDYGPKLPY